METVLAEIHRLYPEDETKFFSASGGKRISKPDIVRRTTPGWKCLINGSWHIFDEVGKFISEGPDNAWKGHPRK